jgi:hypothetical protein
VRCLLIHLPCAFSLAASVFSVLSTLNFFCCLFWPRLPFLKDEDFKSLPPPNNRTGEEAIRAYPTQRRDVGLRVGEVGWGGRGAKWVPLLFRFKLLFPSPFGINPYSSSRSTSVHPGAR